MAKNFHLKVEKACTLYKAISIYICTSYSELHVLVYGRLSSLPARSVILSAKLIVTTSLIGVGRKEQRVISNWLMNTLALNRCKEGPLALRRCMEKSLALSRCKERPLALSRCKGRPFSPHWDACKLNVKKCVW